VGVRIGKLAENEALSVRSIGVTVAIGGAAGAALFALLVATAEEILSQFEMRAIATPATAVIKATTNPPLPSVAIRA